MLQIILAEINVNVLNWLDDDTIVLTGNNSSATAWTIGTSIAVVEFLSFVAECRSRRTPALEIHIESSTLTIIKPRISLSKILSCY